MTMTLRDALEKAIAEFTEYGFDNPARLSEWMRRLHTVARQDSPSDEVLQDRMRRSMETYFKRATSVTVTRRKHPGVPTFTIRQIEPRLRPELTRRIQASTDLIKLNRDQAVEKTLQRFAGWATSVPDGGSNVVDRREVKKDLGKALRQLSYEERRVAIDQGHKLMSSISAVIAEQSDAIAGKWRDHGRVDKSYDARPEHMARDGKFFMVRNSWAQEKGFVKPSDAGYTDQVDQPAEAVFCRCYWIWIYNLRDLPAAMLTEKGRKVLEDSRIKAA